MTIEKMIKRALRTGRPVSAEAPIRFPADPRDLDRKGCDLRYDKEKGLLVVTPPAAGREPLPLLP